MAKHKRIVGGKKTSIEIKIMISHLSLEHGTHYHHRSCYYMALGKSLNEPTRYICTFQCQVGYFMFVLLAQMRRHRDQNTAQNAYRINIQIQLKIYSVWHRHVGQVAGKHMTWNLYKQLRKLLETFVNIFHGTRSDRNANHSIYKAQKRQHTSFHSP